MNAQRSIQALALYAGPGAREIIRAEGLRPERIKVLAGAAGGPKWLVLHGLDRRLPHFLASRKEPLFTIGASIGAWRFLCYALGGSALERFREGYIEQRYDHKPTPREVSQETWRILDELIGDQPPQAALEHPLYRMNLLAVRSRHLIRLGWHHLQALGLAAAALGNLIRRRWLKYSFERTLFYDRRTIPPFFAMNDFPTRPVPLSAVNLRQAVVASGSIPLVMQGVPDIPGAKPGVYFDGGIVDYHIDIEYLDRSDRDLVLYPHYTDRIVPGWLDKHLTWRTPLPQRTRNLVLLCPSRSFVQSLPLGKIPDRDDFARFFKRDDERIAYWRKTVAESERIGDAFFDAVDSGRIRELVQPLPWEK